MSSDPDQGVQLTEMNPQSSDCNTPQQTGKVDSTTNASPQSTPVDSPNESPRSSQSQLISFQQSQNTVSVEVDDLDDFDHTDEEIDKALLVVQEFDEDGNVIEPDSDDENNPVDVTTLTPKERAARDAARKKKRAEKAKKKKEEEEKKIKDEEIPVTLGDLFQFTDGLDKFCIFFGVLGALAQGASMPVLSLYLGNLVNDITGDNFMDKVNQVCIFFAILACASGLGGFLAMSAFMYVAERQSKRLRNMYFHSLLRQEISWFDQSAVGDVASRLTAYTRRYQEGIGDKLIIIIANSFSFVIGLLIAFYRGWELTLILLAPAPIMLIISAIFAQQISDASTGELGKYSQANTIALQAFESIRTAVSYQMENFLIKGYNKYATVACEDGKKKTFGVGAAIGAFYFIIFALYALGLFYGGYLIREGRSTWPGQATYNGGSVLSVFYALLTALMMLGQIGPNFAALASARSALASILEVIHRPSKIHPFNTEENLTKVQVTRQCFTGAIAFQHVTFAYPTRREVNVLDKFTYCFPANESIALCGPSGCGKSTILQLIDRFYDPDEGNVYIEIDLDALDRTLNDTNRDFDPDVYKTQCDDYPAGPSPNLGQKFAYEEVVSTALRPNPELPKNVCWVNLRDINVAMWRKECLGLVNQAPILWQGTIADNIRYGAPDATMEEVIEIAKKCNSHEFIMDKNGQYGFQIVENAANLSGGQKQRLSLARTLIIPKTVVLFDEPTSMLDSRAEREVQKTIDILIEGKEFGSITVAHRLSTIRNSTLIIVMKEGHVVETGTHDELMQLTDGGIYHSMSSINDEQIAKAKEELFAREEGVVDDESFHTSDSDSDEEAGGAVTTDKQQQQQQVIALGEHEDIENQNQPQTDDAANADEHSMSRAWSTTVKAGVKTTTAQEDHERAKKKAKAKLQQAYVPGSTRRYVRQALKHYWPLIGAGFLFGAGEGAVFPLYSWLMSRILEYYYLADKDEMYSKVSAFCGWFVLLGFGGLLAVLFKMIFLGTYSENYVLWFRKKVFQNLLYQEMGFHDMEENSSSILATKLAADTVFVRTLGADIYGQALTCIITVVASFIIAFTIDWKYTLVMFGVFPILSCAGFVQFRMMTGFGAESKKNIERAGLIAVEGLRSIRVVASFNAEQALYTRFALRQAEVLTIGLKTAVYAGIGFGATQFFTFGSYALTFWFGSWLVNNGHISFADMLQVFLMIEMASMTFGQLLAQISNVDKSRAAISDLYQLLDRKSLYDARDETGEKPELPHGKIEFRNVQFHYPTAPLLPVLKEVSFTLDPVALNKAKRMKADQQCEEKDQDMVLLGLIGNSGGGKSTIASQLLPQFYRTVQAGADENFVLPSPGDAAIAIPAAELRWKQHKRQLERKYRKHIHFEPRDGAKAGHILIDGYNVDKLNLSYLRRHIALVQQETQLFFGTIRDNIVAGDESITEAEMIRAAKIAHIHHIVDKLPKKYETILTSNNSLSGGQKARVGIARALARKQAKIIILDESNSALDTITAKVIEKNLVKYCRNKVLIFIAHRLSTIRFANKIICLQDGQIKENGTHDELIKINDGIYSNLLKLQQ